MNKYFKLSLVIIVIVSLNASFQNCAPKKNTAQESLTSIQSLAELKSLGILKERCASCHSGANSYSNVPVGADPITDITDPNYLIKTRLIIAGEPDLSPIYQVIESAEMPPGQPLGASEVTTIKEWIANYDKQASPTPVATQTPTPVTATFNSLRTNVFLPKCYNCHVNRSAKLDTYQSVSMAVNNQNLRNRVNNNSMPPPGSPQLSGQEKTLLLQWIDSGALNN